MAKFRKKPVVIEAFQITSLTRNDNKDWPVWLSKAWQKENNEEGAFYPVQDKVNGERLAIQTLEGMQWVSMNDYIIKGVENEIYPCKPDIFEKTYDVVL
tara:strand:- start:434 stop:730 length:297 start_codon:yes stop_codon:yes gene_type:complete